MILLKQSTMQVVDSVYHLRIMYHWTLGEDKEGRAVKKRLESLMPGMFRH